MKEIVTYSPGEDDGDVFLDLLRSNVPGDQLYRDILVEDLGPAIRSIINRRGDGGISDTDFFATFSEALGKIVISMSDFLCDSGKKEFTETLLASLCAVAALEYGVDVVPTREDVSNILRATMN